MPEHFLIAVDCDYQTSSISVESNLYFTALLNSLHQHSLGANIPEAKLAPPSVTYTFYSRDPRRIQHLPDVQAFPAVPPKCNAVLSFFDVPRSKLWPDLPQIVVIDNLAPLGMKEKIFDTWPAERQNSFRSQLRFYDAPTLVLTSSEWVRREVLTWSAYSPHYVAAIGGGVPEDFLVVANETSRHLLEELKVDGRYILAWIDDEVQNGFELTFAAYIENKILFPECSLLVCYRNDFTILQKIRSWCLDNNRTDIVFFQTTDRELIKNLLANAICLSHPIEYSGFSLKVACAMSQACPVLTTRSSSLPELAADTALYTNVGDAIELAKQMHFLLSDEGNRSLVKNRTFLRSESFRWRDVAGVSTAAITAWLPTAAQPIFSKAVL